MDLIQWLSIILQFGALIQESRSPSQAQPYSKLFLLFNYILSRFPLSYPFFNKISYNPYWWEKSCFRNLFNYQQWIIMAGCININKQSKTEINAKILQKVYLRFGGYSIENFEVYLLLYTYQCIPTWFYGLNIKNFASKKVDYYFLIFDKTFKTGA